MSARLRDAATWRALRKPFRLRLLDAARVRGGISAQSLAARVGITSQLMLYHLQLLEKAGLLQHEGGRRARGQGGRFSCTHQAMELLVNARDPRDLRRLDKVLEAMEREAREGRMPTRAVRAGVRWECLTKAEVRDLEHCMAQVDAVLATAARRRHEAGALPDATHVVSMSLRPVKPGTLPSNDFLCRPAGTRAR